MTNLRELSDYLGLSQTQVSRALNGFADVSETTRARVKAAATELGYRPNVTAQRLRSGRSGIVGLVVPERSEQEESNILLEVLLGLATAFWARGILVVLTVLPEEARSADAYLRLARDGGVDGFVVISPDVDGAGLECLIENAVPFVAHGRTARHRDYRYVDLDNHAVGRLLAEQLAALGHERIALVDGPADQFFARERARGVGEALEAAGRRLEPDLVRRGMMTEQLGESAVRDLFAGGPTPTGLIAGNMVVATGVMRGLGELGLRVPQDVSVVAHDDGLSRYRRDALSPTLGGTHSAFAEVWRHIVEALTGAIEGGRVPDGQKVLAPRIVEGESAAPAGGAADAPAPSPERRI